MICGKLWAELSKLQLFSIELKTFNELSPLSKDKKYKATDNSTYTTAKSLQKN